jgi:prepilin-type N-terminal cleavage/methylation domain
MTCAAAGRLAAVSRAGRSGVTLAELLAVIVIVGLLAALLLPAAAHVRDRSRRAACLSNLKQLALAHQMYWQDYDETTVTSWSYGFPGDFSWYVQPYLGNIKVLFCPSFPVSAEEYGRLCNPNYLPGHIDNPTYEPEMWGYGYNTGQQWADNTGLTVNADYTLSGTYSLRIGGRLFTARYRSRPLLGVRLSEIASPAAVAMIGDTSDYMVPGLGRAELARATPADPPCVRLRKVNWPRHSDGNNMVYADGHAQWYRFNDTVLSDGYPAVLPDPCSYLRAYDGEENFAGECAGARIPGGSDAGEVPACPAPLW